MKLTQDVKIVIGVVVAVVAVIVLLKLAHNQENQTSIAPDSDECASNAKTFEGCGQCSKAVWCPRQQECRKISFDADGNLNTCSK